MLNRSAAAFLAALFLCSPALSQIHVPADHPTIQQAIDAASPGDEVIVAPGTYPENIDLLGKVITLRSSDGPEVTIIDGQGQASVIVAIDVERPGAVIDGFTITGGSASDGGGLHNVNSTVTVLACNFLQNSGFDGGGVYNNNSTLTVANTTFDGNTAVWGGALHNEDSTVDVLDCVIINGFTNHWAAAMQNLNSVVTIKNTQISHNFAWQKDGVISNYSTSTLTVLDSEITHNRVRWGGGGGIFNSGTLEVGGTFFCGNSPDHLFQHPNSGSWDDLGGNTFAPAADLTCDGVVDVSDLLVLLGEWGDCDDPDNCPADLNGDGVVDVSDLLILLGDWTG